MPLRPPDPRTLLLDLFDAGVAAARPGPAVERAVGELEFDPRTPVHVIALGKAAREMTEGALVALAHRGVEPVGGVVVAAHVAPAPHARLRAVQGDHPVPGAHSLQAADAVGRAVDEVQAGALALVLVSGGATSLVGAPLPGASADEYAALFTRLLGEGLDIVEMNAVRRRFSRWAAGRLGLALARRGARVAGLLASDVPGADPATIGSGPCALEDDEHAREAATITNRVVVRETDAVAGIVRRAHELGLDAHVEPEPLAGDAAAMGQAVAKRLVAYRHAGTPTRSTVLVWAGETTVRLPAGGARGTGGRSQELALSASMHLGNVGGLARGLALLAAGTDGRDGPTDAAGAVVDGDTWQRMFDAGRVPNYDLAVHDSHGALAAAGALIPARHTGANVADVCIGLVQ